MTPVMSLSVHVEHTLQSLGVLQPQIFKIK